jgi:hypothetical protein
MDQAKRHYAGNSKLAHGVGATPQYVMNRLFPIVLGVMQMGMAGVSIHLLCSVIWCTKWLCLSMLSQSSKV